MNTLSLGRPIGLAEILRASSVLSTLGIDFTEVAKEYTACPPKESNTPCPADAQVPNSSQSANNIRQKTLSTNEDSLLPSANSSQTTSEETIRRWIWIKDEGDEILFVDSPAFVLGYRIRNIIFVCPICWLRWATITSEEYERRAHIQPTTCVGCGESDLRERKVRFLDPVPGSILGNSSISSTGVDWGLLSVLPEALLRREFRLHMDAWELAPW